MKVSSKRKRHREEHRAVEHRAVQAAGEEQAQALQEEARKEREANEQLDELFGGRQDCSQNHHLLEISRKNIEIS